jgi:hypothetical protein
MAQEDLDNMPVVKTDEPKTAYDNIGEWVESPNDVENREAAAAAGVLDASFIGYEAALEDYESRPDIETLAQKNARNNPADFADPAFMRQVGQENPEDAGGSSVA